MEITESMVKELTEIADENRRLIVHTAQDCGGGHFGGSLSEVEILTALYWGIMKIDPKNLTWPERDYFILSKGHGCAGFGPILAKRGFIPMEELKTFNQLGSCFGMHTTLKMAGVDHPTGSLGHGLSVGQGLALALKLDKKSNRVFVLQGDGEIQEGSVWEAAMSAAKFKSDNLISIIDRNGVSMDGPTEEVMPLEPLAEKWESFGWAVKTVDGHDMKSLLDVLNQVPFQKDKPSCIIANTVKGKGISFMEGDYQWHYGYMDDEQYAKAKETLGCE
jgi:transketolase